jgi:hypothetical protein
MPTITSRVYIVNNNPLCIDGVEIPINCELFNPVEYGYFVINSNTIPDGCGGFLEVGTRINQNQTIGFGIDDDYIKLLHLSSPDSNYWVEGIPVEEWRSLCVCIPGTGNVIQDWAIAASDQITPITPFSDQLLFYTTRIMTFSEVRASLVTPQVTGSLFTIDIKVNGVSIFSTLLTIDNGQETSFAGNFPAVLSTNTFINNAKVTCDVTQIGSGEATGLILYFIV